MDLSNQAGLIFQLKQTGEWLCDVTAVRLCRMRLLCRPHSCLKIRKFHSFASNTSVQYCTKAPPSFIFSQHLCSLTFILGHHSYVLHNASTTNILYHVQYSLPPLISSIIPFLPTLQDPPSFSHLRVDNDNRFSLFFAKNGSKRKSFFAGKWCDFCVNSYFAKN